MVRSALEQGRNLEGRPLNDCDQTLVDLHLLLDGTQSDWLDWSRGSHAKLPDEPVEICSAFATGESDCVLVNGEALLGLFGQGLIKLGEPTLHGLVLTDAGQQLVERLIASDERLRSSAC